MDGLRRARESEAEVMEDLKLLGVQDSLFVKAGSSRARDEFRITEYHEVHLWERTFAGHAY